MDGWNCMWFLNLIKAIYSTIFSFSGWWLTCILVISCIIVYIQFFKKNDATEKLFISNKFISYSLGLLFSFILIFMMIRLTGDFTNNSNSTFESIKIATSIFTPMLTFIVFLRTIKVQEESSENQAKDRISKDFYEILKIFSEKQGNIIQILENESDGEITAIHLSNNVVELQKTKRTYKIFYSIIHDVVGTTINRQIEVERRKDTKEYFEESYTKIGAYLKIFHRIIKILNHGKENGIISIIEYRNYIGILRSQVSDKELAIIYNNAVYSSRGYGMALELIDSGLFGSQAEVEKNIHIYGDYLIDQRLDSLIIGNIFFTTEFKFEIPYKLLEDRKNNPELGSTFFDVLNKNRGEDISTLKALDKFIIKKKIREVKNNK